MSIGSSQLVGGHCWISALRGGLLASAMTIAPRLKYVQQYNLSSWSPHGKLMRWRMSTAMENGMKNAGYLSCDSVVGSSRFGTRRIHVMAIQIIKIPRMRDLR